MIRMKKLVYVCTPVQVNNSESEIRNPQSEIKHGSPGFSISGSKSKTFIFANMPEQIESKPVSAEKPISRITIKELCEDADINRATFYAHYNDQYDLLKKIEEDLIGEINSYLNRFTFMGSEADSVQIITRIFEYIDQMPGCARSCSAKTVTSIFWKRS